MKGLACAIAAALSSAAAAQPFTYQRVFSTSNQVPGAPGALWRDGSAFRWTALNNGRVTFVGRGYNPISNVDRPGVFEAFSGGSGVIADQATPLPGGGEFFTGFGGTPISTARSGEGSLFYGGGTTRVGVFAKFGAQVVSIVENGGPAPGGGTFGGSTEPRGLEGKEALFAGFRTPSRQAGLYRWNNGTTTKVVDTSTPVPGGVGNFADTADQFMFSKIDRGAVTFWGYDASFSRFGYFRDGVSGLSQVMVNGAPGPAGEGTFKSLGEFDVDGDDLAFEGITTLGVQKTTLYARISGQPIKIVTDGTIGPDGVELAGFTNLSIAGGSVVWSDSNNEKVYTNYGGSLRMIAGNGMVLDGKTVSKASFWSEGRDGSTVAIAVKFLTDQPGNPDQAIYLVNLPSPGVVGVLALGGVMASRRRRV